jgi:hypothetical protein
LVEEFTETEGRRKQRFIRMPLKEERMATAVQGSTVGFKP